MSANDNGPILWAEHVNILAERAIPRAYAEKVGLRSVDLREIKRHIEKYKIASPLPHLPLYQATGILIEYPSVADGIPRFRVRADKTEVWLPGPVEGAEEHGSKTITIPRYICQTKPATVVPYITPEAREVAGDTTVPIAILEAPLKACSFAANVGAAIGMGGVLAGGHDVDELRQHEELVAHPELRTIDWRKRTAHIIYDASLTTNPLVALGAAYLATALMKEGAEAKLVFVPHFHVQESDPLKGVFYKKSDSGPDDYTFRNGADAMKKLVTEAVAAEPVARISRVLDEHAKKADRAAAVADLLRELPFRAMLYTGGALTVSEVTALTKDIGFGVRAIAQAAKEFGASLAKHAKKDEPEDTRTVVYVTTDEKKVNDAVIAILANDHDLYQRDGLLVNITRSTEPQAGSTMMRTAGTPTITPIPVVGIRERITERVRLMVRGDEERPAHPPEWMAPQIHARKTWSGIRPLTGIIEAPTMRPDGTILQTPGYDHATGLLYMPSTTFPPVPEEPTMEDAKTALDQLRYLLADYKFAKPMHEAAAIAGLMTPTVRASVDGFAPAVAIDANKRGIGKTKIVDLASIIATGRKASRLAYTRDDNETKKQLTSLVMRGDALILVDNVPGAFGSPVWDEFLTSPRWIDRVLGVSAMIERPVFVTVYVTGNNIEPVGDIARRTLHARLHTDLERPDTRPPSDFKEPDLEGYATANRAQLVTAILTILRAYIVAGSPHVDGAVWGSFEAWADRIAKPLIWLGMEDPCETRTDFEDTPASPARKAAAFLGAWERVYGSRPITVGELVRDLDAEAKKAADDADTHILLLREAVQAFVPAKAGEFPSSFSIGKKIGAINESVEDGLRIVADGERDGTTLWKVERIVVPITDAMRDEEEEAERAAQAAELMEMV